MKKTEKINIRLNDKMELLLPDGSVANSLIQEKDEHYVGITIPVLRGQYRFLKPGEEYKTIVYQESKTFGLKIRVENRIKGKIPMYKIYILNYLGPVQRRDNVRVTTNVPFHFVCNKNLLNLKYTQDKFYRYRRQLEKYLKEGVILDISAGGINFSAREKLRINNRILFFIEIEELKFMGTGSIRHHRYNEQGTDKVINYGLEFLDVDSRTRDRIVKFVFKLMRMNREV